MLQHAELMCFAGTRNAEQARHFYADVLGLKLLEDSPFALVFDASGTMLRIQKVQELTPHKHTTLGWKVHDIYSTLAALNAKGVQCQRYPGLPQDEHGVWQSPSGARIAWFLDPDGNGLSLTQFA